MAYLAAVPARPEQGFPVDDDAPADPDLAGDVNQVGGAGPVPGAVLGDRREVGVVADVDLDAADLASAQHPRERLGDGDVTPAQVGSLGDDAGDHVD